MASLQLVPVLTAFTLAFGDPEHEEESFYQQMKALGTDTTLLVDTYNISEGIMNAVLAAQRLGVPGPGGVRIDSGDLHEGTVAARWLLDNLGAKDTKIVLSSDIDEYTINEMKDRGTPVDAIGAGTRVVTGSGAPTAEMVYKLVEINGKPVVKKAEGKVSVGGLKTAYRTFDAQGTMTGEFFKVGHDVTLDHFEKPSRVVLVDGENNFFFTETLDEARNRHAKQVQSLPEEAKFIAAGVPVFLAEKTV